MQNFNTQAYGAQNMLQFCQSEDAAQSILDTFVSGMSAMFFSLDNQTRLFKQPPDKLMEQLKLRAEE